jgi:hypothetical protein
MKAQGHGRDGGWPAAVAHGVGGRSWLVPSHPGEVYHVLYLPCDGPCGELKEWRFSGNRLPPDAIIPKLKKLGWKTGRKLNCPGCTGHVPKPKPDLKLVEASQVKEDEVAKSELLSGTTLSDVKLTPSAAARATYRQVVNWLEEAYDIDRQTYKDGFSDASVAAETGASPQLVADIREKGYGPAFPPEPKEITQFREKLASFKADLDRLESTVTAARGTATLLHQQLEGLIKRNAWK